MKNHMGFLPQTGEYSAIGLDLPDELTQEQWREAGIEIAKTGSASKWWLGDWWVYGEHRYGDRQAIVDSDDWDGPKFQTCKNAGVVARQFEKSRRRYVLSFKHHEEVSGIPEEWQEQLLDEAHNDGFSCAVLRQRVKEIKVHLAQGWTPEQQRKRGTVESGRAVLANMTAGEDGLAKDNALITWADSVGLLERIDRNSIWGNPFLLGEDGDRQTVIANYRIYFGMKPSLQKRLAELQGKVLACWCCPDECHGDVLIELVSNDS